MPDTRADTPSGRKAAQADHSPILLDPVRVALGYLAAFEDGRLASDGHFLFGYLKGITDRVPRLVVPRKRPRSSEAGDQ